MHVDSSKAIDDLPELIDLKRELPGIMEAQKCVAKILRAKFLALIAEGFSDEQALYLCAKEHPR